MAEAVKYPRTPHLPCSPGVSEDDIVLSPKELERLPLFSEEIIVTEKLDGGNCSIYRGKVYARTTNSEATHPSFGPIKQLAAQISFMIPDNIQLFGENMFGIHSIEYDKLDSFFYVFAALEDQAVWLSWDSVAELSDSLGIPTVPVVARRKFTSFDELQSYIEHQMKQPSYCSSCLPEGFVVRTPSSFPYLALERHTAKYVRKGHIQTSSDWRQTWKQAKINKK